MSGAKIAAIISTATNPAHIGIVFTGRPAWAGLTLTEGGECGVSRIEHASTSLPFYIWQLRQRLGDYAINTKHEKHGGMFQGTHARYTLGDPLMRFERCDVPKRMKPAAVTMRASKSDNQTGGLGVSDE